MSDLGCEGGIEIYPSDPDELQELCPGDCVSVGAWTDDWTKMMFREWVVVSGDATIQDGDDGCGGIGSFPTVCLGEQSAVVQARFHCFTHEIWDFNGKLVIGDKSKLPIRDDPY